MRAEVSLQPNPGSRAMQEIAEWLTQGWVPFTEFNYDLAYEAQIGMD